jgi:hypothetical protein
MYLFKNILKLSLTASLLLNGYLNAQTSATKIQSTSVPFLYTFTKAPSPKLSIETVSFV